MKLPRPKIYRRVEFFPDSTYFVPMGVPSCKLEQIDIMMEELEAMRLKDIEGLNQEECAKRMNVSRQTFQKYNR
jgi:Predicted DNA-binding proteins